MLCIFDLHNDSIDLDLFSKFFERLKYKKNAQNFHLTITFAKINDPLIFI